MTTTGKLRLNMIYKLGLWSSGIFESQACRLYRPIMGQEKMGVLGKGKKLIEFVLFVVGQPFRTH